MKETYSRSKSVWQRMNARERKAAMAYGEKYKAFLDTARTERLAAAEIIRRAEEKGFKPVYTMKSLKAGDKVYWNQKDKSVILAVIGKEPVHEGIKIVGSHIDSPRLDLKANPVHEQDGIVYFRTHYYGGIKKYQWTCIPLALGWHTCCVRYFLVIDTASCGNRSGIDHKRGLQFLVSWNFSWSTSVLWR